MRKEIIGNCTLYLGDSLEIMPTLAPESIDLVITDPPYGIGADKGCAGFGTATGRSYEGNWDKNIPSAEYFKNMIACSKNQIIFGGNYFTEHLPPTKSWIIWDKVGGYKFKNPFSDCELAWTSFSFATRKIEVIQQGFVSEEKERWHPTQKPVKLMEIILNDCSKETDLIADFFMGSGTTGVACPFARRPFIGVEIDPKYFDIACRRIEAEVRQGKLF